MAFGDARPKMNTHVARSQHPALVSYPTTNQPVSAFFLGGYISETFADTAHHKPALVLHSFKNADVWGAGIRASCLPPLPRCPRAPRAI